MGRLSLRRYRAWKISATIVLSRENKKTEEMIVTTSKNHANTVFWRGLSLAVWLDNVSDKLGGSLTHASKLVVYQLSLLCRKRGQVGPVLCLCSGSCCTLSKLLRFLDCASRYGRRINMEKETAE